MSFLSHSIFHIIVMRIISSSPFSVFGVCRLYREASSQYRRYAFIKLCLNSVFFISQDSRLINSTRLNWNFLHVDLGVFCSLLARLSK